MDRRDPARQVAHRRRGQTRPPASCRPASPDPGTCGCSRPGTDSSPRRRATHRPEASAAPERPGVVERLQRRRPAPARTPGRRTARPASARAAPRAAPPALSVQLRRPNAIETRSTHAIRQRQASRHRRPPARLTVGQRSRVQRPIARRPPAWRRLMSVSSTGPPPRSQPAEADVARCPPARSSSVSPRPRIAAPSTKMLLPGAMDTQRHQVVHQVVARRDAVEHGAHHARASPPRRRGGSRNRRCRAAGLSLMRRIYSVQRPPCRNSPKSRP